MKTSVRRWLPPPLEGDAAVERAVVRAAAPWLADWFRRPPSLILRRQRPGSRVEAWRGSPGCRLGAGDQDALPLGMAVLEGEIDDGDETDQAIAARLGEAMIADLAARLDMAPGDSMMDDDPPLRFALSGGSWTLPLELGADAVTALRSAGAPGRKRTALVPLSEALAGETVVLGCTVGAAILPAGDIAGLAPGDLLVLDRKVGGQVPLTVAGRAAAIGSAAIGGGEGLIEIRLVESPGPFPFARMDG